MKYKKISTYSYNLHIIKTNKFKTVTVQVNFKRKMTFFYFIICKNYKKVKRF